jgi:small GTP-binding protein
MFKASDEGRRGQLSDGVIQKKICMLGSFAVGKTSLVSRFVRSIFSEQYQTTIGVKIDKKSVKIGDRSVTLLLWDLHGDDEFQRVRDSYLKGASGHLLVIDGTRRQTWEEGLVLRERVHRVSGEVPVILILNKTDLENDWELEREWIDREKKRGTVIVETSAKTGEGVEEAFTRLVERILEAQD